jgi:hypothetical protein
MLRRDVKHYTNKFIDFSVDFDLFICLIMPRPICETFRSIDVRWIYRQGRKIFALSWSRAGKPFGQAYVVVGDDGIFFVFVAPSDEGSECSPVIKFVPITWTACHFGGRRPWFVCPRCGRRIAAIYIAGEYVACRRCFGLAYASQQEPVRQRGLMKAQKIRMRLGGSPSMIDKFPDRPKGVHEKTFRGLRAAHDQAAERCMAGLSRFLSGG